MPPDYQDPDDLKELLPYMDEPEEGVNEDDLLDYQKPELKEDFSTAIVVDNLPAIPAAKFDKLVGVLKKVFGQMGTITENGMHMPLDEKKEKTLGFAYVNFSAPEEATKAVQCIDGWNLDKAHALKVNLYEDLIKFQSTPDEYEPPEEPQFKPRADPSAWLSDPAVRDQFVVRFASETHINWAEKGPPQLSYGGEREKERGVTWCERYVMWSPQGTYLATFHRPGVALWGGGDFDKQARMAHTDVRSITFSPQETYMVTNNFTEGDRAVVVWDLRDGKELRAFSTLALPDKGPMMFKWSHDDKYLARMGQDLISIYELPSMKLLQKRSLKAEGVQEFEWSPTENKLVYWSPEKGNSPASVTVVELPSRKELRSKNMVNVSDCKLHWQSAGQYLCVKVLRHTKSKKTKYNDFELFRIQEELVPVEQLELKSPSVEAFAWEPEGHRFAVLHEKEGRPVVEFYSMQGEAAGAGAPAAGKKGKKGGGGGAAGPSAAASAGLPNEVALVCALEGRTVNQLHWSPNGGVIVLGSVGDNSQGTLEFYDVDHQHSMCTAEHYRMNYVQWDPSGRLLASAVVQPIEGAHFRFQVENGYYLWTFQGKNVYRCQADNFYQLLWRPRPASLLTAAERQGVVKNLRKYERRFDKADREQERRRDRKALRAKIRAKKAYRALLAAKSAAHRARRAQRVALYGGWDEEDDSYYVVESHAREVVVEVREEVVGK
ncbi:unnamed protein product [Heterosigma akashiwo]